MTTDIKQGDFITLDYVGKIKGSDRVFDLTREEVAKSENIFDEKTKYGPVTIIVGAQHVLPGLDKELDKVKVGEKKTIEVSPDEGFGKKNPELLKLVPRNIFKRQKLNPVPGMPVQLGEQKGIVQTVSGGRIKVDFNHPLAGKTLEYEVEVHGKVSEELEQVKSLFKFHLASVDTSKVEIKRDGDTLEIETPEDIKTRRYINLTEEVISRDILKYIKEVKKVKFIDIFK